MEGLSANEESWNQGEGQPGQPDSRADTAARPVQAVSQVSLGKGLEY